MLATGKATRSLMIALVLAPVVILGYVAGLSHGPQGVAAGFSTATILFALPVIFWATKGTSITGGDILKAIMRPFLSILIGAAAALTTWSLTHLLTMPLLRLTAASVVLFGVYGVMLCFVMGQKAIYLGLLQEIGIWPFVRRRKGEASEINVDP
jgi:hypothetical protein